MVNRREFLGLTAGASAALVLPPQLLRALQHSQGSLIQRAIPSTGEMMPVIGLGFANHPTCSDQAALKEVLRAYVERGGRMFDSAHSSNPAALDFHIAAPAELGVQSRLFRSISGSPQGPPQTGDAAAAGVRSRIETMRARMGEPGIDLAMVIPQGDPIRIATLLDEKRAGRIRYAGSQVITDAAMPQLAEVMRSEPIDFVAVTYDVGSRRAEETILPLALERKIAVMVFFPFGNNGGVSCGSGSNLFARVGNRPVPDWAAEFDATTWAQFFLKYVISHPAVTVARVSTSKVSHLVDNMGGGIGRLPDEATRRRMAAFIDALPPVAPAAPPQQPQGPPPQAPGIALAAAVLDRYVGEYRAATGFTATFRRDGTSLMVTPGNNPEAALNARSETRFQDPRGPIFEFQLDAQGRATSVILIQGDQRVTLERR